MKKLLVILLAALLLLSVAACAKTPTSGGTSGNNGGSSTNNGGGSTNNGGGSTNNGGGSSTNNGGGSATVKHDPVTVHLAWTVLKAELPTQETLDKIEAVLHERLVQLGYDWIYFKFDFYFMYELNTQTEMGLAAGEEYDILMTFNLANTVQNGYFIPLDKYFDNYLADAVESVGQAIDGAELNGKHWAIPAHTFIGSFKWAYNTRWELGIEDSVRYNWDGLEDLLAAYTAKYPNTPANAPGAVLSFWMFQLNNIAGIGTGGATVGDDPTVVNKYELSVYEDSVRTMYRWMNNGYNHVEVANGMLTYTTAVYQDAAIGCIIGNPLDEESVAAAFNANTQTGATFKTVTLGLNNVTATGAKYGISYTCKHPDEAAIVLNIMWTDSDFANIMMYGLEGDHYVWNEDHSAIRLPDGYDSASVPYCAVLNCGFFSDEFLFYAFEGNNSQHDAEWALENETRAFRAPYWLFTPNTDNISSEVAAVSNVISQYEEALGYGRVNPDTELPAFRSALKDAGIDIIIADLNEQCSEWLASR